MRTRYSIIFPIAAILAGVLLVLNSLGFAGNFLPADILMKAWPALLAFAGLDMLFSQRRMVGALVFLFSSAALLSAQFMGTGADNMLWHTFIKIWPVLLILFGIDWIFTGNSVINTIVIIAGVIVLIYILFTILDVPVIEKLPFKLNLTQVISTIDFNNKPVEPQPIQGPQTEKPIEPPVNNEPVVSSAPVPSAPQTIIIDNNGQITIAPPAQSSAELTLQAASGNISVKPSGDNAQFVRGTIHLDPSEKLTQNADLSGSNAKYMLKSEGNAASSDTSDWELAVSGLKTAINASVNSGYIKADLRNLNLSSVNLENNFGPIDIMIPQNMETGIKITAADGDVRVYVPGGAAINCTILSAGSVDFPQYSFNLFGNVISSRRPDHQPIDIEINANNGYVQIIESK